MNKPPNHSVAHVRFPALQGESLARKQMQLPADLAGDINLLFVAFLRDQQFEINRWMRRVGDLEVRHNGLEIYEVPVLRRFPGFYRGWIDNGMRSGIPDPKARERTVTVYTDRKAFLESAGLADVSQIWTVLVDRTGTIFWSHVGRVTDDAEESLHWAVGRFS